MRIDYEKVLNPGQYETVSQTEGPFLVIAGAGSGKTRTLVYRVARLVENGVSPESILLLTFTRKASMEMLYRASSLLDDRCSRVSGGTFHSVANKLLRRYGSGIGIDSGFSIMDSSDAQDCIKLLKNEKGYGKQCKQFPRKSTLAAIFSLSVNKREPVELVLSKSHPQFLEYLDEIKGLQGTYSEYKKKHHLMDYDDLLVYFKELLEAPEIQRIIEKQYRFLMVDEFQDTNILQAEIIALLGAGHHNVMAVGDPAQSIYSFRGANFRNILQFEKLFPSMKAIKLEENYRSTQKILDVCNALMLPAKEKYGKKLFNRENKGGALPTIVENETPLEEACFIVDKVEEVVGELNVPLNDIAVLFRNSFHSFQLELELNKRGIAFVKHGGFKFVETAHVKDAAAHLRVVANPADTVSWSRLLLLIEGMGPKTALKVIRLIQSGSGNPFAFTKLKGFSKFMEPFRKLERLFTFLSDPKKPPVYAVEKLLDYYYPILEVKYDDHPKRRRDLDEFLTIAGKYDSLEQLLTDMTLEPPNTARDGNLLSPKGNEEYLVLSTVHSAKGLEWSAVFVMGASEGSFPNRYAMEKDEDMEEERRLFYVAATRAKERLYFTFSAQRKDRYGSFYSVSPSPFLDPLRGDGMVERIGCGDFF